MAILAVDGWNCELCKSYNDILSDRCAICSAYKPDWITGDYQARVELKRGIFLHRIQKALRGGTNTEMTPEEKLYSEYYNSERLRVKDMNDTELSIHIEELSRIAFEARARAVAGGDEGRARRAKAKDKNWNLTPNMTGPDIAVTDAINAVKIRKDRMTHLDKEREKLLAKGIDEEIVNDIISRLGKTATERQVKSINFPSKIPKQIVVKVEQPDSGPKLNSGQMNSLLKGLIKKPSDGKQ